MIYRLHHASIYFSDNFFDAELIEFPGYEDVSFENPAVDDYARGAPDLIEFVGNMEATRQLDYIATVPSFYLLISKKMVEVLLSVQPFRHQLFPCRIYSYEIAHLVRDESTRERTPYQVSDPSLYSDDFVILKLRDTLDCFDPEHTLLEGVPFLESGEEYLGGHFFKGSHIALREPEGGFPPVFYVPRLLFYCYSEEAKQACERAGLKGLRFEPLP